MRNINLKPLASSFLLWFTFAFLTYAVKGVRSVPQLKNRQTNQIKQKNLSSEQLNVQRISFLVDRYNTFISSMAVVFLFLLFLQTPGTLDTVKIQYSLN